MAVIKLPDGLGGYLKLPILKGDKGEKGDKGNSILFNWDGMKLGVKIEGDDEFIYTDLEGARIYIGETMPDDTNFWYDPSDESEVVRR